MTSYKKLSEAALCKDNNLNAVKLIAAMMVIVSHAYAFAGNYARTDWFSILTGQKGDLGGLAVSVFFFYSGLLITMSLQRNSDLKRYVKRRAVRIYPAYFVVTVLIVFVAAPFITNLSVKEYFLNSGTYAYLKNLIFITEHNLPGVFVNNIYARSVNGPIWTVRVEVMCYVLCYVFYGLKLLNVKKIIPLTVFFMVMLGGIGIIYMLGITDVYAIVMPVSMFFIGMIYAVYSENIRISLKQLPVALAGFMILCIFGQVILASIVFLPVILCNMAFGIKKRFGILNRLGEYSYEIYLWGGFTGQAVSYMFGGSMNEHLNMIITIPVTMILGYLTNIAVNPHNKDKNNAIDQ